MLLAVAGIAGIHHNTQPFSFETGLALVWNSDPPDRMMGIYHHPSYWLGWGLIKVLPSLALNHDPPVLSLPSS
jgi:hypothetical protein